MRERDGGVRERERECEWFAEEVCAVERKRVCVCVCESVREV